MDNFDIYNKICDFLKIYFTYSNLAGINNQALSSIGRAV